MSSQQDDNSLHATDPSHDCKIEESAANSSGNPATSLGRSCSATTEHMIKTAKVIHRKTSPTLSSLPLDIIVELFKLLQQTDQASVICLGLTNKAFYHVLKSKSFYPGLISLSSFADGATPTNLSTTTIPQLLYASFSSIPAFATTYRLSVLGPVPFLRRTVYGFPKSRNEVLLQHRYEDYALFRKVFGSEGEVKVKEGKVPNPFGMGEEWYRHMADLYLETGVGFGMKGKDGKWEGFWNRSNFFWKGGDKDVRGGKM